MYCINTIFPDTPIQGFELVLSLRGSLFGMYKRKKITIKSSTYYEQNRKPNNLYFNNYQFLTFCSLYTVSSL